jgi:hypothetical protein
VGQIGREFVLGGLAVLAGLPFGSAIARAWLIAAGQALGSFPVFGGVVGGFGWLVLYLAWRGQVGGRAAIGAPCAFIACASLTGVGGIVWGQAS